jgi:hypothetical protein
VDSVGVTWGDGELDGEAEPDGVAEGLAEADGVGLAPAFGWLAAAAAGASRAAWPARPWPPDPEPGVAPRAPEDGLGDGLAVGDVLGFPACPVGVADGAGTGAVGTEVGVVPGSDRFEATSST